MRTLTAVQLDPTPQRPGGWHYASLGKRGGGPIGFCAEHDPHETEQEARECYAAYKRSKVRLNVAFVGWHSCHICGAPAKTGAEAGSYEQAVLCAEHLTDEHAYTAMSLDKPARDSWQS